MDNMFSQVFLNDNVYYVTWEDYMMSGEPVKERFFRYMRERFTGLKIRRDDEFGTNIAIYKLSK